MKKSLFSRRTSLTAITTTSLLAIYVSTANAASVSVEQLQNELNSQQHEIDALLHDLKAQQLDSRRHQTDALRVQEEALKVQDAALKRQLAQQQEIVRQQAIVSSQQAEVAKQQTNVTNKLRTGGNGLSIDGTSVSVDGVRVTLYGVVNAGFLYVNNDSGKPLMGAVLGAFQPDRWGLTGSEDLGDGLEAIFTLENGFNMDTGKLGQGGLDFGRQAFVGLSDVKLGTITFGRQYDLIQEYIQPTTMNGIYGIAFNHASDIDNTDSSYRIDNSVKYISQIFDGLTVGAMYAFGNIPGNFGADSMFAGGAGYSDGPLYLGAVYEYARDPVTQFTDGEWVANSANPGENGAFGYVGTSATSSKIIGAAAKYTFDQDRASVNANYTNTVFKDANGTTGSVTFNDIEVWGQYNVTPRITIAGGYTHTSGKADYTVQTGNRPSWDQFNSLFDYHISKNVDAYVAGVLQKAGGGASADVYNGIISDASSNSTQYLILEGLRVKF